jgi:branched-chain amino acid transport system ATP-binding protein
VILLETVDLSKQFGDVHACDHVNFTVNQGEFLSLVGSNGAGKTSLVNLISGHLKPDSGRIMFEGRDVTSAKVYERIRAGIARSFQIVNLFDALSVFDNVALSIFSREGKVAKIAAIADHDREVRREALDVLNQFGLAGMSGVLAGGLAQGERKLLDVAVAYALRPKLLFLDEPTSGVSTRDKTQIMDTVSAVVRAGAVTAVVIEHDMDVVFRYSDRIVMMHEGKFLADGTPDEIKANKDVANILLGAPLSAGEGQARAARD